VDVPKDGVQAVIVIVKFSMLATSFGGIGLQIVVSDLSARAVVRKER